MCECLSSYDIHYLYLCMYVYFQLETEIVLHTCMKMLYTHTYIAIMHDCLSLYDIHFIFVYMYVHIRSARN